jgi:hypothetical protein
MDSSAAVVISKKIASPAKQWLASDGCKFSFGSNNAGARRTWAAANPEVLQECKLGWQDFFVPGAWTTRAVDRKGTVLQG